MARPARPLVWHQLRFALPLAQDAAVGLVERILADGSLGRVVLELRASSGQAVWVVGSSAGERLISVVRELVPGCRVSRGFSRRAVDQAVVVSARPIGAGLATERLAAVVRAVLAALVVTAEGEELVVQLQLGRRFSPQVLGRVEPQGWLELLGLVPIPSLSGERGRRMRAQVGRHRAAVSLRLGVRAASPLRQRVLLQGLLGALRLVEGPGVRLRARTEHPAKLDAVRRPWRTGLELGAGEIVAMAGWPIGELPLPLLGSGHPRLVAPPPEVGSGASQRVIGASAVPGETGLVRLPITDAVYHTHLLGPTGVGKSTVLLSLALADAAEGRGLLLLDPKGDLATDFVARLPQERAGDVVVLDPTNPCPVGFNPLVGPPELAVVTAEAVLGVLAELFRDSWGIRTADVLSAALLTLARIPQATLVWLVPLLTNPAFRRRVLALAPADPLGTDVFWQGYEAKPVRTQAVEVAPVLNKLRQLMLRPGLRAMLGQAQAYATVMHQGRRSGWFSLAARPAPPAVRDPALLYAASHARYGIPAEQTEAELIALTNGSAPSAVDANEQRNPTTVLPDTTTVATAAAADGTGNEPGDEAAESMPGVPDEASPDGTSNGAESEPGRSRPAIGRRRRP